MLVGGVTGALATSVVTTIVEWRKPEKNDTATRGRASDDDEEAAEFSKSVKTRTTQSYSLNLKY